MEGFCQRRNLQDKSFAVRMHMCMTQVDAHHTRQTNTRQLRFDRPDVPKIAIRDDGSVIANSHLNPQLSISDAFDSPL
jgi:hypothetical protein